MNYFVTAIHTDSGKTLVSAILCEFLHADYWKPVQAGYPTDASRIRELVSEELNVHAEGFRLNTPASPHAAAALEDVRISCDDLKLPTSTGDLIIEGAGGILVPLNDHEFVIDIALKFNCEVLVVSNLYLGSINHTLLTIEALKNRKAKICGIIFNGPSNPASESFILKHTGLPCLLRILPEPELTREVVKHYALKLHDHWNNRIKN